MARAICSWVTRRTKLGSVRGPFAICLGDIRALPGIVGYQKIAGSPDIAHVAGFAENLGNPDAHVLVDAYHLAPRQRYARHDELRFRLLVVGLSEANEGALAYAFQLVQRQIDGAETHAGWQYLHHIVGVAGDRPERLGPGQARHPQAEHVGSKNHDLALAERVAVVERRAGVARGPGRLDYVAGLQDAGLER